MSFSTELENFKKTGRFQLINDHLCTAKLAELSKALISIPTPIQFALHNVELISYKAAPKSYERSEQVLSGAVYEYGPRWNERQTDFQIYQWYTQPGVVSTRYFKQQPQFDYDHAEQDKFQEEQNILEESLINLLILNKWEAIRLEKISFNWRGVKQPLSYDFTNYFFRCENITQLKELSIKNIKINAEDSLSILERNNNLTHLAYEINTKYGLSAFEKIIQQISAHPSLKELDLGNTLLDIIEYKVLALLLDNNYQIEKISLREPEDKTLRELHRKLMRRLEQRPIDRFKQEQLTQAKLLALAEKSLIAGKSKFLKFLLNQPASLAAINCSEYTKQEAYRLWPQVYQTNRNWIDADETLIQLDLQKKLTTNPSITIGGYLLAIAAQKKDQASTHSLLNAYANPLEKVHGTSLLMQALQDKNHPAWRNTIITYVQKGLGNLSPQLSQLAQFVELHKKITEISDHLVNYLVKLDIRNHKSSFIKFITGISSRIEERKYEVEKSLNYMVDLINEGTKESKLTSQMVNKMYKFAKLILKDAEAARRGLMNHSDLNDGLEKLCLELKILLKKLEKDLLKEEIWQKFQKTSLRDDDETDKLRQQKADIQKKLEHKCKKLKNVKELLKRAEEIHEQDRDEITQVRNQVKIEIEKAYALINKEIKEAREADKIVIKKYRDEANEMAARLDTICQFFPINSTVADSKPLVIPIDQKDLNQSSFLNLNK